MACGEAWVVESFGGILSHPDFFHDAGGAEIGGYGERNDFGQLQRRESMTDDGESCLGGEALSPDIGGEAPADFDAWGEMRFE